MFLGVYCSVSAFQGIVHVVCMRHTWRIGVQPGMPLPWAVGLVPCDARALVFGASVQRGGHVLGSSVADRTGGPVTVSDYLQALLGVSKARSGSSPGLDGKYTHLSYRPAGAESVYWPSVGVGRRAFAGSGFSLLVYPSRYVGSPGEGLLRAGLGQILPSGRYCGASFLALRQGSLFH